MKKFKFRESLKKSWEIYKNNWRLVLSSCAAYVGIVSFLSSMDNLPKPLITGAIWDIISTVFSVYISFLFTKGILKFIDTHSVGVNDLKFTQKQITTFIKTILILLGLGIIVGIILLLLSVASILFNGFFGIFVSVVIILLAVYGALRLSFMSFFLIDHASHMSARSIIEKLWEKTDGKVGSIIVFGIKILLLNLLGLIALGIGLVITLPLSALIKADFYREQIQDNV
jgi:hypothetical protein